MFSANLMYEVTIIDIIDYYGYRYFILLLIVEKIRDRR